MPAGRLLVPVLAYASLLVAMLFNLVIPLIPILPDRLDTTPSSATWVATAFFITGAVSYAGMGRLADMYGTRRVFFLCTLLLIVGSVVCALAGDLAPLLVGRVLQGASLPVLSISLSILREQVSPAALPAAAGLIAAGLGAGNALGLVGGGFLLDRFSWTSVFWATALMTLPLCVAALLVIPPDRPRPRQRLDLVGTVGLTAMLVCVLLPLSKLAEWGPSVPVVVLPLLALALLPGWVRGRLRTPDPVIDLRALRRPPLLATHLAAAAAGYGGFMAFIVTTNALQNDGPEGFGLTLTQAGLCMAGATTSFLVTGPLTGRLLRWVGLRWTYVAAGVLSGAGAAGMAGLVPSVPRLIVLALVIFVGNAMFISALPVGTAEYADASATGSANGVNALCRTVGLAFASGVFALVSGALPADAVDDVLVWGQVSAVVVAVLVVALCAWAVPSPKPPSSRRR
jgi:MFS family permease